MRLGVEDYILEIERVRRREEQVEILERLRKQKTLHRIGFLFRDHALKRRVTGISAAVLHEVSPHLLAHAQVPYVLRVVIEVVSRLDDLGPQWIARGFDRLRAIVKDFRL